MLVSDILKEKGHTIRTVPPTLTIGELSNRLRTEKVGAMIVSIDGRSLDGIISERDIVHGLADHGAHLDSIPVAELCTSAVHTCRPDDSVGKVARLMTVKRVRHVPVVQDDRLVGIVSIGDVLKHRLVEVQLEANVLRDVAIAVR